MSTDSLPLDISKTELHSIEPAYEAFETDGSFAVVLRNHGRAVHVHCNLDDDLARVAAIDETNHFVETDSSAAFQVTVAENAPRPVSGKLKVVTAYGAEETHVPVTLTELQAETATADAATADVATTDAPAAQSRSGSPLDSLDLGDSLPVVVLAVFALVLALGAALVAGGIEVLLGALVVVVGVVAALVLLYR
ncbi:DUF7524 family protein [Haloarchaeobius sp. DFWS5]|uniref:DUF7524 family protein n=1 Tax=Haloarchaeobius sp. DFWS5 TaxID=3446114 RepID=UPI003EB80491